MKILIILSIFSLFVLFNLYIRVRTLGYYKALVSKKIQFTFSQMLSSSRWKSEVLSRYPSDTELLNTFRKHILRTGLLFLAIVILVFVMLALLKTQLLAG